jgi:hypothetical protein
MCGAQNYQPFCQKCKDKMALKNESLKRRAREIISERRIVKLDVNGKNMWWAVKNRYGDVFEICFKPDSSKWTCTCKSFVFNQGCSHIEAAKMIK